VVRAGVLATLIWRAARALRAAGLRGSPQHAALFVAGTVFMREGRTRPRAA
jgi:hypothetical protein